MYTLKFDGARKNGLHWTAIGPEGLIGCDVATQEEARDLIVDRAGPMAIFDGPTQHGPCLFWTLVPHYEVTP